MKLLAMLALAVALHAEDTKPLATVEELTKQVAALEKQIMERDSSIIGLQAQVNYWSASAIVCDSQPRIRQVNAQVDAQAKANAKNVGNAINTK